MEYLDKFYAIFGPVCAIGLFALVFYLIVAGITKKETAINLLNKSENALVKCTICESLIENSSEQTIDYCRSCSKEFKFAVIRTGMFMTFLYILLLATLLFILKEEKDFYNSFGLLPLGIISMFALSAIINTIKYLSNPQNEFLKKAINDHFEKKLVYVLAPYVIGFILFYISTYAGMQISHADQTSQGYVNGNSITYYRGSSEASHWGLLYLFTSIFGIACLSIIKFHAVFYFLWSKTKYE